ATEKELVRQLEPESDGAFTLEAKHTYVFKLQQKLGPEIRSSRIHGQATAKSSVGRVDVLARLIVDGMDSYECFDPNGVANGNGHMYVEITPITFSVRVKDGYGLSQLREMRIHYAGFVHPLFGRDRKDGKVGTPLIFEVRGHDV